MIDESVFKPIKMLGYIYFIGLGNFCLLGPLTANWSQLGSEGRSFYWFCFIMAAIHILIGVGIVTRRKWGYNSLRYYMYFLRPGFPVGTLMARKVLGYMEENNIKDFFLRRNMRIG